MNMTSTSPDQLTSEQKRALYMQLVQNRSSQPNTCPLSFSQEGLWFLEQMEPVSATYNNWRAFRLKGPLDHGALEKSVREIVRRHETLRTRFVVINEKPVQSILPSFEALLPLTDLSSMPADQREAEARRLTSKEVVTPFHLSTGPLFRAKLLRLSKNDHVFILTIHPIIS